MILAVCGGLRAGELFALQRKHVDDSQRRIAARLDEVLIEQPRTA